MSVRVRFAPSPSGSIHLGNARIAVINYLFVLQQQGKFLLRVDDTDVKTSDANNIPGIVADLRALGVAFDGEPVYQSSRAERYRALAQDLQRQGMAYPCFCSAAELEIENRLAVRANRPPRYSGKCKRLSPAEIDERRKSAKEPPAIRFNVEHKPRQSVLFHDEILGDIETPLEAFGDFVILRASGMASYNFASAVDDIDMQITHIIRGADHVSNTARQAVLWDAMGVTAPKLAHVSLLSGEGGGPLSKRAGDGGVRELLSRGYMPEAVVHYLASIGNSNLTQEPCLSLSDLAKGFAWPSGHGTAHYEQAKLDFFNRLYLHKLPASRLLQQLTAIGAKLDGDQARNLTYLELFKDNMATLLDAKTMQSVLASGKAAASGETKAMIGELLNDAELGGMKQRLRQLLDKSAPAVTDEAAWKQLVQQLAADLKLPKKSFFMGLRLLLTGEQHGPELHKIMMLMGPKTLLSRLD